MEKFVQKGTEITAPVTMAPPGTTGLGGFEVPSSKGDTLRPDASKLNVGVLHLVPSLEVFPLLADPKLYEPNTIDISEHGELEYWLTVLSEHMPDLVDKVVSGGGSGIGNDIGCDYDINRPKKNGNIDNVEQRQVAMQSKLKNMSCGYIHENTKCKLLHWCGDGVVAEGRIASTYPNIKVHHVPLGGSCWKVWVDRVLVEHVDLIQPNSEMTFLEEAIGSTIAWFSKFIVLCE